MEKAKKLGTDPGTDSMKNGNVGFLQQAWLVRLMALARVDMSSTYLDLAGCGPARPQPGSTRLRKDNSLEFLISDNVPMPNYESN